MHPILVACLVFALLPAGLAGTGGAVESGIAGEQVVDSAGGQLAQVDTANQTTETSATHPTRTQSAGYMIGSFFIRFGPMLLVIGLLAWILLTRD